MSFRDILRSAAPYGLVAANQRKTRINNLKNGLTYPRYSTDTPELYNANGEKMLVCYLQDHIFWREPYCSVRGRTPGRLHWDRYNYELEPQFYTHEDVLSLKPFASKRRFAWFIESEEIVPNSFEVFDKSKGLEKEFTAVFTHSARQLNALPNAKFVPGGGVWYGTKYGGGVWDEFAYEKKTKNVSIVSSDKTMCKLHEYRLELAKHLKGTALADTFGSFDGGGVVKIADTLTDYRYSIAVENNVSDYYFTEKLMNCFAAMTVPIYIGAEKIGEFFNSDGIIQIAPEDFDKIDKILSKCCEEDYRERIDAIKDNYNRVQAYLTVEDWMFEHYGDLIQGK